MKVWSYHKINRIVNQVEEALLKAKRPASEKEVGKLLKKTMDKFVPKNTISVVSTKEHPLPENKVALCVTRMNSFTQTGITNKMVLDFEKFIKTPEECISDIKHELTHALQSTKKQSFWKRFKINLKWGLLRIIPDCFDSLKNETILLPKEQIKEGITSRLKSMTKHYGLYEKKVALHKGILYEALREVQAYKNELSGSIKLNPETEKIIKTNLKIFENMAEGVKASFRDLVKSHNREKKQLLRRQS